MTNNKILVIKHSIHKTIENSEIEEVIKRSYGDDSMYEIKEIVPIKVALRDNHQINFYKAAIMQYELFKQLGLNNKSYSKIVYFGAAPIPLAVHLGYLLEDWKDIDVFQQNHDTNKWDWINRDKTLEVQIENVPKDTIQVDGIVTISLSTAIRVSPETIRKITPQSIKDIKIETSSIGRDVISSFEDLKNIGGEFKNVLDSVSTFLPDIESIHLFAAIPVGLAFLLGTKISPTIHPTIVTYQFSRNDGGYKEAIRIQKNTDAYIDNSENKSTKGQGKENEFTQINHFHGGQHNVAVKTEEQKVEVTNNPIPSEPPKEKWYEKWVVISAFVGIVASGLIWWIKEDWVYGIVSGVITFIIMLLLNPKRWLKRLIASSFLLFASTLAWNVDAYYEYKTENENFEFNITDPHYILSLALLIFCLVCVYFELTLNKKS